VASSISLVTSLTSRNFARSGPTIGFQTSTASARALLPVATIPWLFTTQLRIINFSDEFAYIEFGDASVVATPWTGPPPLTCSYPMLPNSVIVVNAPVSASLYIACVLWQGNGGLYVTPGLGDLMG
jgi:hypothetical protein